MECCQGSSSAGQAPVVIVCVFVLGNAGRALGTVRLQPDIYIFCKQVLLSTTKQKFRTPSPSPSIHSKSHTSNQTRITLLKHSFSPTLNRQTHSFRPTLSQTINRSLTACALDPAASRSQECLRAAHAPSTRHTTERPDTRCAHTVAAHRVASSGHSTRHQMRLVDNQRRHIALN